MSDTPMELARDIVNLIMESESYLRYKSALEQIISTPEQLEKLKEVFHFKTNLAKNDFVVKTISFWKDTFPKTITSYF